MSSDGSQQRQKRGQWANKREFILAVAGQIIGLSNVWRFLYLCFKNGGGKHVIIKYEDNIDRKTVLAVLSYSWSVNKVKYSSWGVFLVPYVVFLSTCGIPLFFAETSLGQFSREGGITCWKNVCHLAKGCYVESYFSVVQYYNSNAFVHAIFINL